MKSIESFRFGGHQSFALRIAWLPKATQAIEAGQDPLSNPLDGVVQLGIGKNMVEALRCWIEAYGVAHRPEGAWELTEDGKTIFGKHGLDPYLEDARTLWWLHWKISTQPIARFYAWELLINRWNEPTFTASAVVSAFMREAERSGRRLAEVSLRQHFDIWLRTYCPPRGARVAEDALDSPLAALGLVRHAGERDGQGRKEAVYAFDLGTKRSITQALFRYCLYEWWEQRPGSENTAPFIEVATAPLSPGRVLRMPEREVAARLAALANDHRFEFELIESLNQYQIRQRREVQSPQNRLAAIYDDPTEYQGVELNG